jgi:hypothetical protein
MNNQIIKTSAMDKVLSNWQLIGEIQNYVDIKSLLNTYKATVKYYEDEEFRLKLHSMVDDPKRQIQLNNFF